MEKKKKLRLEIYKPKREVKVSKEKAVPFLIKIGGYFIAMGGIVSFVLSGVIMGIKSFFDVKQKFSDKKIFNKRKYVELRITENSVDSVIFFIEFSVCIILSLSDIITRIIHKKREEDGK